MSACNNKFSNADNNSNGQTENLYTFIWLKSMDIKINCLYENTIVWMKSEMLKKA